MQEEYGDAIVNWLGPDSDLPKVKPQHLLLPALQPPFEPLHQYIRCLPCRQHDLQAFFLAGPPMAADLQKALAKGRFEAFSAAYRFVQTHDARFLLRAIAALATTSNTIRFLHLHNDMIYRLYPGLLYNHLQCQSHRNPSDYRSDVEALCSCTSSLYESFLSLLLPVSPVDDADAPVGVQHSVD